MDNRDNFGDEIKKIMEEETFGMTLSQETLDNIYKSRKKTIKEKIGEILNKEIEIPLTPAIIGLAALFAITIIPRGMFGIQRERVVDMGGSQVIIRESHEVSMKWK